ncbi:sugar MFS transporter [Pedobacter hartonius]|uniref:Glucose/galactose transporter n=1 Tax=Pedobacter hartonius TaxID=425514 RepID=A0A1H3WGM7_9SPHI|nr:sugar MFS transporter [Pedobacter hartonius]SDZ86110.1 glucose/galactose transporter [Pedobacter hartonius]
MTTTAKKGIQPIFIIGALFFVFGFVTWLNSVLIPYLRLACELNNFESYLVAFAFYISYLVMAIPSAGVLNKTGFKNGMALGLVVMGAGALIFIPAALTRTYALFLLGLFVQGTGLALLQTASNPYITILGPADSAAKRISVMGICNKVAGAIAPIILGAIALKDADGFHARLATMNPAAKIAELNLLASRVILPYAVIIVVLVILAVLIYFSTLPEIDADKEDEEVSIATAGKTSVFQFPHLLLGVVTMFLYVGVEVMAGDTVISYGAYQGIPLATAKFFTSFTLLGMILGYLVGIVCIPKYLSQENAMKWFAALGVVLTLVAIFTTSYVSVLFIALLGFANSMVYPAIWPLALNGVGRFTKMASSLLIMGIAGGAVIPLCYGGLADIVNPQQAYWIMVPCYVFIFYYATTGCKVGKSITVLKNQPVI